MKNMWKIVVFLRDKLFSAFPIQVLKSRLVGCLYVLVYKGGPKIDFFLYTYIQNGKHSNRKHSKSTH